MFSRIRLTLVLVLLLSITVMVSPSLAQDDFNWRQFEGQKITVFLTEVAMSQGIRQNLQDFIDKTGIEVEYLVVAEAQYWDKLNVDLSSGAGEYDVFMSGASFAWGWSEAGWIEPLDPFIEDPALTPAEWNFDDFYPWAIAAQRWDGTPGPEGLGKGELWSLPVNAETTILTYRKDLFDQWGLKVPETWQEWADTARQIKELSNGEVYSVLQRGALDITSIQAGYISSLFSYGGADFHADLTPAMNDPKSVEFTKLYIDTLRETGAPEWASTMWYDLQQGMTTGKFAMTVDGDNFIPTYENAESSQVAGKLGYAPIPAGPDGQRISNIWTWGLSMNSKAENKGAAWLFMVWASGTDTMTAFSGVGSWPTRASVWNSDKLVELTSQWGDGSFREVLEGNYAERAKWLPAPMVDLPGVWNLWIQGLQNYYYEQADAQGAMDWVAGEVTALLQSSGTLK